MQETQVEMSFDHINVQVFHLLEDLEVAGQTSNPRGLKTVEANLGTLQINPLHSVMDFPSRRFNWKYFAGELGWYLKADPSIEFINNFSSFWKDICPQGKANSNYGNLLFNYHPSTVASPKLKEVNQLEWVYECLVKDKNSRQAVAFFNAPYFQYPGNKDFVCTMYVNFWIRKGYLDMKVQMRSNDIFFGLTYDAPWFSTLMQSMYLNLKNVYPDLKLGVYYHCADNIHYYERHFDLVKQILDDRLDSSISMRLKKPLFIFTENEGKQEISLSPEAKQYLTKLDEIVNSGQMPKDQLYWRSLVGDLYEIV